LVRLVVNKAQITVDGPWQALEHDVLWQFWFGQPPSSGGAQRSDVDDFLTYTSPLKNTTYLPAGVTAFATQIHYGPAILAGTFRATLNGSPFAGFHPVAGTTETVSLPLVPGRNVLRLGVRGIRSDGRVAVDRDQLIFVVP
jgi:hypothetical protein